MDEGTIENVLAADPARAVAAGLTVRPLERTIADTWDWLQQARPEPVTGWGIPAGQEARLLRDWQAEYR